MPIRKFLALLIVPTLIPATAAAGTASAERFVREMDRMMVGLAAQNAEASATIRELYHEYLDLLVLGGYDDLEDALWNGGLAPLPDPGRFNITPRTEGSSAIAEKDLANQESYIAARPATVGALLDVAARVTSGPIEVTSLVRHSHYQEELSATNVNATTTLPMHTMGLAFDIALVNTPISRVHQILSVLEERRDAGDILFIGERKQLVFHVVPHPSRLGHFTDIYARALAGSAFTAGDSWRPTVPAAPLPVVVTSAPKATRATVSATVVDVRPTHENAAAWWSAVELRPDLTVSPSPAQAPPALPEKRQSRRPITVAVLGCVAWIVGLVTVGTFRTGVPPTSGRCDPHGVAAWRQR